MLNEIDLSRADLNLLVLFETVLRERHVGRASRRLHLSASAVSHGLGRLRRLLADPVFLRTPRGVVPTARALELATPIAEILAGARKVLSTATPFDPRTSSREFIIGAPDGASTVFLLPLLERIRREAPGLDVRLRQLLPQQGGRTSAGAWDAVFDLLDGRVIDVAVGPFEPVPARFTTELLREEDFAIVSRRDHPYAQTPGLQSYCSASHLVVSLTGDPRGFVDRALAERGRSRRVALTVPSFSLALALVADTDLLAAVPRTFALAHAPRMGLVVSEPPLPLPSFDLKVLLPGGALTDSALGWLQKAIVASTVPSPPRTTRARRGGGRSKGR